MKPPSWGRIRTTIRRADPLRPRGQPTNRQKPDTYKDHCGQTRTPTPEYGRTGTAPDLPGPGCGSVHGDAAPSPGGGGGTAVHDPPANGDEADPDPGGFLRDHRGRRAVRSNLNQGKGDRPRSGSRTLGRRGG
ncbi:hypothetical protein GCM10027575_62530 [Phytohabitans suffuscus]